MELQQVQPVVVLAQMLGKMMAMHREQTEMNRRHLEAFHTQAEKQPRVLESLLPWSRAALPSPPPLLINLLHLHHNPQTFLEMFQVTAAARRWSAVEWVVRLLPLRELITAGGVR